MQTTPRPKIVCLCGSTRFGAAFEQANLAETLAGHIVLSIACTSKTDAELFGHLSPDETAALNQRLDQLHRHKIDLADEILVINVDGYIGPSTQSEIDYACAAGKPVRWLETKDIPACAALG
jgi:hypothetical protein